MLSAVRPLARRVACTRGLGTARPSTARSSTLPPIATPKATRAHAAPTASHLSYEQEYARSLSDPNGFWLDAAKKIRWKRSGTRALSLTPNGKPFDYRWYAGDEWMLNACDNAVDRHVDEGRGDRTAIIWDSPVAGSVQRRISYRELQDEVSRLAGAMRHAGVKAGDRVSIYMPMIPETFFGILATARLGAIHCVVFGGFPAHELAKRIADAKPTVILTASCGLEGSKRVAYMPELDKALEIAQHKPEKVLVLQRPQLKAELKASRDVDWQEYVKVHGEKVDPVPMKATDSLYLLHTSGTTGLPKGVVRDIGSIVAARNSMDWVFGHDRDGVFWTAADIGWAVGHTYTLYGPLLQGSTTVVYEGKPVGTPDAGAFWRVAAEHRVEVLFTAPTALRAIRKEDPTGKLSKKYDLSSLRAVFLAGERADPPSLAWARDLLHVPVYDNWWQSETGWPISGPSRGFKGDVIVKDGSASRATPGWDVRVLDDEGSEVPRGTEGNLAIKLPLPPSGLHTLWQNHERFVKTYVSRFPGWYDTADAGRIDQDAYIHVMARTDDVLKVAGHLLSSGQMEEVLQSHPAVAESAVVAMPDTLRGSVPLGIVVLKGGQSKVDERKLKEEVVAAVRAKVGAVANFRRVVVVARLPKTRSGKLLRNVLRAMAEGLEKLPIPPTIEDEAVIAEIRATLDKHGIGVVKPTASNSDSNRKA